MGRKRLFWSFYPSYVLVIGVSLLVVLWFGEKHLADVAFSQKSLDLEALAHVAGRQVGRQAGFGSSADIEAQAVDRLCKDLGKLTSFRFTVVLPGGR